MDCVLILLTGCPIGPFGLPPNRIVVGVSKLLEIVHPSRLEHIKLFTVDLCGARENIVTER
jgi:hypothetical protein